MGCYDVVGTLKLMPKEDENIIEDTSNGYEEYAPFVIESDSNVWIFNTQPQQEIIQNRTLVLYQHMNQIHMLYIYQ